MTSTMPFLINTVNTSEHSHLDTTMTFRSSGVVLLHHGIVRLVSLQVVVPTLPKNLFVEIQVLRQLHAGPSMWLSGRLYVSCWHRHTSTCSLHDPRTPGSTQLHSNTQPSPTAADTSRDSFHLLLPQRTAPLSYCTMTHPRRATPRIFVYLDNATSPLPLPFPPKLPQLIQSYVPPTSTATIPPIFRACPTLTRASATTARSTPVGRATAGTRLPPVSPGTVGSTRSCARSTTGFGRRGATRGALSVWWLLSRRGRSRARAARMARRRAERATGQAGPRRRRGGSIPGGGGIS